MEHLKTPVKTAVFQAMQNADVKALSQCPEKELRAVLPCLVRMALCASVDASEVWTKSRKHVLKILSGIEIVNNIVALLSIDFHALEQDVKKEQQLRSKLGGSNQTDSILITQLQCGLALEFERSDPARRIRLLLSQLLFVMAQVTEPHSDSYQKQSELFESDVYIEEVSDVLCIAQAELPNIMPLKDVAEALLCVKNGTWLLCRLLANSPDSFMEVCTSLVVRGQKHDEDSVAGRRRMDMLLTLCRMNPTEAINIRSLCVEHCTIPGLTISLTLRRWRLNLQQESAKQVDGDMGDIKGFTSSLLLHSNPAVRTWFCQFVKAGQKKPRDPDTSMLHAMRLELLRQLTSILPQQGNELLESNVIEAGSFICLYCALKAATSMKFLDEETKALLALITCHPPTTSSGAHLISLSLSMLLVNPQLPSNPEQDKQVVDWIKWLRMSENSFEREARSSTSFGEMLFLIAIHFHSNQTHAISDLVCSTLGIKCSVKASALSRIRQIFTQEIFTEQVIASHAVMIPVTRNLNAHVTGYLPVHSIYQLLKSRAFSKHNVPIKDWIYRQICSSVAPLHPLLPPLVEAYVNSIIIKSAKTDHTNEPIAEHEALAVFKDCTTNALQGSKDRNLTACLLMLYYVLLYEDTFVTNLKTILLSNRNVGSYSEQLMAQIPINVLIQEAQKEQPLYAGLFAPILRLLITQYPHLCLVEDWLEQSIVPDTHPAPATSQVSISDFTKALSEVDLCPAKMIILLTRLKTVPLYSLLPYADTLVASLPLLLAPSIPRKVTDLVNQVWFRLHAVMPRKLRLSTVDVLQSQQKELVQNISIEEKDIIVDPLIILRCEDRVYRCPPILEIMLRILSSYIQACRVMLSNQIQTNPVLENSGQVTNEQERRDLCNALVAAQESAIVQILLECCLADESEKPQPAMMNNLREVQCLICSFLHQQFISDPNLAKLVHFQGYPKDLLPITVAGIPSMHICLDFIPELLSQPQAEKQVFAISLLSHLCSQYALPKALSVAKLALSVLHTLVGVLDTNDRALFFIQVLPSLARICQSFPPLCEDITSLLSQLGRVCLSNLAATGNGGHSALSNRSAFIPRLGLWHSFLSYGNLPVTVVLNWLERGYPKDLLPITVAGIPSMHICLDFIPELLSQPQAEKQVFAISLLSHLCSQYALPKALSVAKLALSVLHTLVGVLDTNDRALFFIQVLPSLARICQSFPPLCEDITSLLSQLGRVCLSNLAATGNGGHSEFLSDNDEEDSNIFGASPVKRIRLDKSVYSQMNSYRLLFTAIQRTFSEIYEQAIVTRNLY